jgi:hypothetical protein
LYVANEMIISIFFWELLQSKFIQLFEDLQTSTS